MIALKNLG